MTDYLSNTALNDIFAILKTIRPELDFSQSKDFIGEGLLDSFDVVTLVSALDKKYGVSIPGTEIVPDNFKNLEAIETLLRKSGAKL
ncbi:MAG: acyl carrier protein [Verrucomicrobiota bacterium]